MPAVALDHNHNHSHEPGIIIGRVAIMLFVSGVFCLVSLLSVLIWFAIGTSQPIVVVEHDSFAARRKRRRSIMSSSSTVIGPARLGIRLREEWEVEETEIEDLDRRRHEEDIGGAGYRQVLGGGDEWGVGENEGEALAWGLRRVSFMELAYAPGAAAGGGVGGGTLRSSWEAAAAGGPNRRAANVMLGAHYKHVLNTGRGGRRASELPGLLRAPGAVVLDDGRRKRRGESLGMSSGSTDCTSLPGP